MIDRGRVAIVVMAIAVWIGEAVGDLVPHQTITDVPLYEEKSGYAADGLVPYRDFVFEYPPLAFLLILIPRFTGLPYGAAFSALMLLALVATAWAAMATARALGMTRRRELAVGAVISLLPVLLGDFVATRFDLAVAALLAGMLWSAVTDRFGWAWAFLAGAIALKLFPVVLVPVVVFWHRRSASTRDVGNAGALAAAGCLATFLPGLVASPGGLWTFFSYHLDRPLQLESLGSSVLLGVRSLARLDLAVINSFGSQNLTGGGSRVLAAVSAVVVLAGVSAIAVTAFRSRRPGEAVAPVCVGAIAATLAVTVAFGKVLSPQFLVWLLPACLLVGGRMGRIVFGLTVAALVVTQAYFPSRYWDLVDLDSVPVVTLIIRNALLVALVVAAWPRASAQVRTRSAH